MPRTKKEQTGKQTTEHKATAVKQSNDLIYAVYTSAGGESSIELPKALFSETAHSQLLAQYTRFYLANQRQGTASAKTRGQVTGSTRKIYRQKGTGRARHGSIKAPIFVGGGVVGGPLPRDHSLKMNQKQRRKALLYALHLKQKEHRVYGLKKEFITMEPKTKTVVALFKKLQFGKTKILLVVPKVEKNNLLLAVRNIPNVRLVDAASLNAYEVLASQALFFVEGALETIEKQV